jgi:hypothetical protein
VEPTIFVERSACSWLFKEKIMEAYSHLSVIERQQPYGHRNVCVRRALFAVTGVLALASSSSFASTQPIQWGECPPVQEGFPEIGTQQCALVRVPLDYRRPTGALIDVAVSRISAADPAKRRGALLLNIGGPGGRGLDMPRLALALYPQEIVEAYDLIGFDPRGIGRSVPVSCGLSPERSLRAVPMLAEDGGFEATANFARDVAAACGGAAGSILPFITTTLENIL